MFGLGFAEILVLTMMAGGANSTDLASLIPATPYFQSRQIEITLDKMVELAGRDPKDPKTQIQQLVALKYLADESDSLKKAANYAVHRQLLEQIAQGTKAADSVGFAKDYAERVLRKLDGAKPAPLKTRPLREDALSWFPADATFVGAVDMRHAANMPSEPLKELLKMMPDQTKKQMFGFIEQSGNIRIERLAVAFVANGKERNKQKIFVRLTGKANQAWLATMFKELSAGALEAKEMKDAEGVPIIVMNDPKREPLILMLGNTDLMIAGYSQFDGKHEELLPEILAVRARKKPSVTAGVFKARLAKIPDKAIALAIGDLDDQLQREARLLVDPPPTNVTAFIERVPQGLDVQVETSMANGEDAAKLVRHVGDLRKKGIDTIKQAQQQPPPPGFPPVPFVQLINLMESLQVQNQDNRTQVRVVVPENLLQQLPLLMMPVVHRAGADVAPPPVEVKKK